MPQDKGSFYRQANSIKRRHKGQDLQVCISGCEKMTKNWSKIRAVWNTLGF